MVNLDRDSDWASSAGPDCQAVDAVTTVPAVTNADAVTTADAVTNAVTNHDRRDPARLHLITCGSCSHDPDQFSLMGCDLAP